MRYSNIHTHTTFSDGKNTPLEMAQRALELNFVSLGFSDHSETLFYPDDCMKREIYLNYTNEVQEVKKRFEGRLEVFCGIEKDYFSHIDSEEFEYVIGSVHYIATPDGFNPIDHTLAHQMEYVNTLGKGDPLEYAKRYYEMVVDHAQKCSFEVQGHFDLVNKFGLFDNGGDPYEKVALEALEEVMKHVPYFEVNTGAIARGYRTEPYPADFLLKKMLEKGAKLVLNGDSHRAEHLDCHYAESICKLKKMGFDAIWQRRATGFEKVEL